MKTKRERAQEIQIIQRQMAVAANELDRLAAMLGHKPDKQKELRGAANMLAEWEIAIENEA